MTTWSPVTQLERRAWLLANGEVVTEPDLETTPSGRKVRVAGTKESVFMRDLDTLVTDAVWETARQRGTSVWMALHDNEYNQHMVLGHIPERAKPQLHLIHGAGRRGEQTTVWWKFRHAELPIEATVAVTMQNYGYGGTAQTVTTRLAAPRTHLAHPGTTDAQVLLIQSDDLNVFAHTMVSHDDRLKVAEFIRDNDVDWDTTILGAQRFDGERVAVQAMLKAVHRMEEIDSIQIPDLRDLDNASWLTLELHDSNITAEIVADLAEYLDGTPSIDEALRLYKELQQVLRKVGLVMEDLNDNAFQAGLLAGNKAPLTVAVEAPAEAGHGKDHGHSLTMHLPSGTFIVNCALRTADQNEIAEKWEEARVMASLTGEENELLAYARAYGEQLNKDRTTQILKERNPDSNK